MLVGRRESASGVKDRDAAGMLAVADGGGHLEQPGEPASDFVVEVGAEARGGPAHESPG